MKKAFLNWSSGKDAAFALYLLRQRDELRVEKLMTSIDSTAGKVSMHGLRKELLLKQAESIGLPLHLIPIPGSVSMETYNGIMKEEISKLLGEGFTHSVFGDIFLEDLKEYREKQLAEIGMETVFPLWKKDTSELITDFIKAGFKAITVSVNARLLDATFCGKVIDADFLARLPSHVDPCGENGEFHSFVFDGPIFRNPVSFRLGETFRRSFGATDTGEEEQTWDSDFLYCDLLA